MGGAASDQPGLEVRPLRPVQGDGRLPARLVHGLARRRAAHHARHWETSRRAHLVRPHVHVERPAAGSGPAGHHVHAHARLPVHRGAGSPATSASTTCSSVRATPRPARRSAWPADVCYGVMWAAAGTDIIATHFHVTINDITYFLRALFFIGPVIAFFVTQARLPWRCSARTARSPCTATRPAASCASRTASSSRSTPRWTSTSATGWSASSHPRRCPRMPNEHGVVDRKEKRRAQAVPLVLRGPGCPGHSG